MNARISEAEPAPRVALHALHLTTGTRAALLRHYLCPERTVSGVSSVPDETYVRRGLQQALSAFNTLP
ncbi:MAG: hypothetical protein JST22_11110 [Bacteroidetes bacterium]|nr:hypothetical protein [Bacteroidota bacterium]